MKKNCNNCHFLIKHTIGGKFVLSNTERKEIEENNYTWLNNNALACDESIWDETRRTEGGERKEYLLKKRKSCFFWPHKPGMGLPAAKKLRKKRAIFIQKLFIAIVVALISVCGKFVHSLLTKPKKAPAYKKIEGDDNSQTFTSGNHSSVTKIDEQNLYFGERKQNKQENKNFEDKRVKIAVLRLIEDFDHELDSYKKVFWDETERINNDLANRGVRGGAHIVLHKRHANEGKDYIELMKKKFIRNVQDLTLENFKIETIDNVDLLSKETIKYKETLAKSKEIIESFFKIVENKKALFK